MPYLPHSICAYLHRGTSSLATDRAGPRPSLGPIPFSASTLRPAMVSSTKLGSDRSRLARSLVGPCSQVSCILQMDGLAQSQLLHQQLEVLV